MHKYVHIYRHTCLHTYVSTYVRTYLHTYMYTCTIYHFIAIESSSPKHNYNVAHLPSLTLWTFSVV